MALLSDCPAEIVAISAEACWAGTGGSVIGTSPLIWMCRFPTGLYPASLVSLACSCRPKKGAAKALQALAFVGHSIARRFLGEADRSGRSLGEAEPLGWGRGQCDPQTLELYPKGLAG